MNADERIKELEAQVEQLENDRAYLAASYNKVSNLYAWLRKICMEESPAIYTRIMGNHKVFKEGVTDATDTSEL